MTIPDKQNPPRVAGFAGADFGESRRPQYTDPVETFKHAHGGRFTRSGNGYRTTCPLCPDGKPPTLAVGESDGWLRLHCFRCHGDRIGILAAVGLRLVDVGPPRSWPESPEERRRARRAMREAGWSAALRELAREATVIRIVANELVEWLVFGAEDNARLKLAVERIDAAAAVLVEAATYRPEVRDGKH